MSGSRSLAFALLADGRFPAGGHVHSAGVEAAILDGRIAGLADLEPYVLGRLHTTARTEAALAAAAVLRPAELTAVDREAEARITPPSLRLASRRLGRQLVRVAAGCWPSVLLAELSGAFPGGAHQPVALGAVGLSAGLDALDVARLAVHHAVTTPVQAAVRLLGLDPFAAVALTARIAEEAELVANAAAVAASGPLRDLPARTAPVVDIAACEHASRDAALFAT
jgi:urease accessory protein